MWGTSVIMKMAKGLANITFLQSENVSRRLIAHEARKADVEIYKTNTIASHKAAIDLKTKFAEKLLDASPEERLRLRQDIEYLDQDIRQIGIYKDAEKYLQNIETVDDSSDAIDAIDEQSSQVWLDVFNDYARRSNESWRADLLSRALALEAQTPGLIGQRALWFIGTVDGPVFHTLAALLDVSVYGNNRYVIPEVANLYDRELGIDDKKYIYTIGHAIFDLTDLGILGDAESSTTTFFANEPFVVKYASNSEAIELSSDLIIRGIIFTKLAQTIAMLYDPKATPVGEEIFSEWINGLKTNAAYKFVTPASNEATISRA